MAQEITFDEYFAMETFPCDLSTYSTVMQECSKDIFSPLVNKFSSVLSPQILQTPRRLDFLMPVKLLKKQQVSFNSPHRLVKSHSAIQRLNNPSFNQPPTPLTPAYTSIQPTTPKTPANISYQQSTPKTPYTGIQQATPLRAMFDTMLLTTPMLINTLDNLQQQSIKKSLSPYPDILQLIDDDSYTGKAIEHHIGGSEENITDSHIVDHVLDLLQNTIPQATSCKNTLSSPKCQPQPMIFRRGRRRTKLMTEEERISLQRIKQEKQKQKRKEKFKKPPRAGTRQSKRIRRQVVKYC